MKKRLSALLFVMIILVLSVGMADGAKLQVEVELTYRYDLVRPMLDMINDFRTGDDAWAWNSEDTEKIYYTDMEPLEYDYGLERIAMQRAAECAVHYDHTRPDGTICFEIYPKYGGCGENIAAGYTTTKSVFVAWREDNYPYSGQGHRRNMLSSYLQYVGIGCVYAQGTYFWCQVFCSEPTGESASSLTGPALVDATAEMLGTDKMTGLSAEQAKVKIKEGETAELPAVSGYSGGWGRSFITVLNPPWVSDDAGIIAVEDGKLISTAPGKTTLTVDLGSTLTIEAVSVCTDHTWDDGTVTTEATCTAEGVMTYLCDVCGETETQPIPMIPHTLKKHQQVDPTCTEDGYEAYWECRECHKLFCDSKGEDEITEPEAIPAKGHTLKKHQQVEPACTEDGYEAYWECGECARLFSDAEGENEIEEPEVIPAKGHTLITHNRIDAACTETGIEAYWECSECDRLFSDAEGENEIDEPEVIPAKGHSLEKHDQADATCEETGYKAYWACGECGRLFNDSEGKHEIDEPEMIPAKGHTLKKHQQVEPTCTEDGYKAYWECKECHKLFSDSRSEKEITEPEAIPAKGHSLKKVNQVDATDTTEGTEAYWKCSDCGRLFSDAQGKNEIKEPVVIPMKDKVAQFINRCYKIILDRKPDAGGMQTWLNELNSGRKAASEIIDRFVNSPEYLIKNYNYGDSVDILYQAMLGRNADEAGKANWVKKLESGQTLAHVINGFCFSNEFRGLCDSYGIKAGFVNIPNTDTTAEGKIKAFVQRCYRIILDREADPSGMQTWYEQLSSGKKAAAEIIDRFVNSPEFSGKNYSHSDSVEILYKAMLGRGSDAAGKANWVSKLDAGQPFAVVINGFCVSKEFTGICDSYGIKPGNVNVQLSGQAEEEALSMLALNAKAPITRRSETKPNRVEIINPSDTIDMNIGTAVQAVYINEEKAKEFVGRCYKEILGRDASPAELENWIGQMVNGTKTPDQIARGFLFSNEFKAKNTANEDLVKILYRVYMNRDADPEGLATWTEKLDEGTSLNDLLNTFSKTNEFKKVVSEMSK